MDDDHDGVWSLTVRKAKLAELIRILTVVEKMIRRRLWKLGDIGGSHQVALVSS
jgi:hypothetical protein